MFRQLQIEQKKYESESSDRIHNQLMYKKKKFKIALNNSDVDPTKLTRSKQENKALMKGKAVEKKKRKTQNKSYNKWKPKARNKKQNTKKKRQKGGRNDPDVVITERARNQSMFDSFRVNTKRKKKSKRR
eukprot:779677_1